MTTLDECRSIFKNEHYEVLRSLFFCPRIRCNNEEDCELDFTFSYEILQIEVDEADSDFYKGAIQFDIKCYPHERGEEHIIVDTSVFGIFSGSGAGMDEALFKDMLELNGLTFLSQIVRTHILSLTSITGNAPIILPMIDVTKIIEKHYETV